MGRPRMVPEAEISDSMRIETAMRLLPVRRGQIDADEHALIGRARDAGWTWQEIADALGLGNRSSACDRYDTLGVKLRDVAVPVEPESPGTVLNAVLDGLGMSQAELARRTDLSPKHVNQVAQGVATLSIDVAIKLESATGVPAMVWNTVEAAYRDALARRPA